MTQDATIPQTTSSQPSISRLAYLYIGSPVAQVVALSASVAINPAQTDNDDPAPLQSGELLSVIYSGKTRMRANSG